MIGALRKLFRRQPEGPYEDSFFLAREVKASTGGAAALLDILSKEPEAIGTFQEVSSTIFEWNAGVQLLHNEKTTIAIGGENIGIKLVGDGEDVNLIVVDVRTSDPPRSTADLLDLLRSRYGLSVSGFGNNPYLPR